MHKGGHLKQYYETVNGIKLVEKFITDNNVSEVNAKMLLSEELNNIRKDLLNGVLKIHN